MIKFTSWSPSRLADYEQCPAMAKWKHLDKLCPLCFKGRLSGGFGTPVSCDTCGARITASDAIERGTKIGEAMEKYLKGEVPMMPPEVASNPAREAAATVRKAVKAVKARIEFMVVLDRDWRPTTPFSGSAWLRAKMDALVFKARNRAHVIDWKTGGIDKKTGEPRKDAKYDDQLSIYTVATLCAFPDVEEATAALVFLDAKSGAIVERPGTNLKPINLPTAKMKWENKLTPMMNDDVFAPSASFKCQWCDYSKSKGGPCPF